MLTNKQRELLDILVCQEGTCTIETYAKRIGVSKRTIHTYLDLIQPDLEKRGFKIVKNPGKGISVISLHTPLKEEKEDTDEFSIFNRRIEIVYLLFIYQIDIDLYEFCDEFYVSESSIRNDLSFLNHQIRHIKDISISIVQGKIVLQGDSSTQNISHCLIQLNEMLFKGIGYERKLIDLCQLYDEKVIKVIDEIVHDYINDISLDLAEYYKINLVSVLVVMTTQALKGRHIHNETKQLVYDRVKFLPNLILAKQFLARLQQFYDIDFTDDDSEYLAQYLIADRIQIHNFEKISVDDREIFERILKKMEVFLKVDFSKNPENREKLLLHFNAMVFRLRKGIYLKNEILSQIKKEFEFLFNLIWIVLEGESKDLNIKITEDEVGFLLIHFQNFIDQQKQTKKILLICPYGIATSEMVLNRLRQILPAFDSIETVSADKAKLCNLDSIDFVVSTTDVQGINKPVVRVSSIISEDDVQNIMKFYQKLIFKPEIKDDIHFHTLIQYIDSSMIFYAQGSKESIIMKACQLLEDKGYVEKDYYKTMINREKIGSTDNIYQVALPHGDINLVKKTVISFAILEKPMKWKNHHVKLIIFFNIAKKDLEKSRDILGDIYQLIHSRQLEELLKGKVEVRDILKLISTGVDNDK